MKKKICILTATRADYGLLRPFIEGLLGVPEFDLRIVVTGMHLSREYGMTCNDIVEDGFVIDRKIDMLLSADTPAGVTKSMGVAMLGFADYFKESKPDLLLVLGDRYETLAVCIAAMNERIPIAHLYGGETTEGAVDEGIRHAITKLSYLHFTSTLAYRRRVIQLGEHPDRVYQIGAAGIENIKNRKLLSIPELEEAISFPLDGPYGVITMHPVTLEKETAGEQFATLLKVCGKHTKMKYIFTKANADAGGKRINSMMEKFVSNHENAAAYDSLGTLKYLSLLRHAYMAAGNSSSGILEAPFFGIPVINIGDRQKGRLKPDGVIDCEATEEAIERAFEKAGDPDFRRKAREAENIYGDGNASAKAVEVIKREMLEEEIDLKKKFYDIEGDGTWN